MEKQRLEARLAGWEHRHTAYAIPRPLLILHLDCKERQCFRERRRQFRACLSLRSHLELAEKIETHIIDLLRSRRGLHRASAPATAHAPANIGDVGPSGHGTGVLRAGFVNRDLMCGVSAGRRSG